jgi:hypothetical protein
MKCFITNRDCKTDHECRNLPVVLKDLPEHSIFMISSYGFPFDDLFNQGIAKTINLRIDDKEKHIVERADQALQLGYVMCERICRKLRKAEWAFADVTEPNGNVYYELGLAYGMNLRIVLLCSKQSTNPYLNCIDAKKVPMLNYGELANLQDPDQYVDCLARAYQIPEEDRKELEPQSVLEEGKVPTILNVQAEDSPALDLHRDAIERAIASKHLSWDEKQRPEGWVVENLSVGTQTNLLETVKKIGKAKICLFDATHFGEKANAAIFFLLGVAHATEREVIPLVNHSLNRNIPFDIKGLWQVNFEKADQLNGELEQILPNIDRDFKRDREDHPYRRVWDPFILQHKDIHIMTCARGMQEDKDRTGGRTDIDLWDFKSVSELSLFIAQRYDSAKVPLDPPKNKKMLSELQDNLDQFHQELLDDLQGHDSVIIGSPDVSDYAEVVLAHLHGIEPHKIPADSVQMPFRFVKKTEAKNHPRRMSAFYRLPGLDGKEKVEFGGKEVDFVESIGIKDEMPVHRGTTYAVITIAKWPTHYHTMVISGFTGIATFAAMRLLTDCTLKAQLMRYLGKLKDEKMKSAAGVNILVSVDYTRPDLPELHGDRREPGEITFSGVEFIPWSQRALASGLGQSRNSQ